MTDSMATFYQALADGQRVRILHLLAEGPWCGCYLREILGEGQVKVSKQLGGLRKAGLVSVAREGAWRIYRLAEPISPLLRANLEAWRDHPTLRDQLAADRAAREAIMERLRATPERAPLGVVKGCCRTSRGRNARRSRGAGVVPMGSTASSASPDPVAAAATGTVDPWNDFPL
jgi:ArsR family transcriptional regulator, arsenate/arsenite/antimonite-responsive transcriptional repressor